MNRSMMIIAAFIFGVTGMIAWRMFTTATSPQLAVEAPAKDKDDGLGGRLQAPEKESQAAAVAKLSANERLKKVKEWAADKAKKEAKRNLLSLLEIEKHAKVRAELIRSLGAKWRSDPEVIPALTRCRVNDESDEVREATEEALRGLGEDGQAAVPALKSMLQEEQYRIAALKSLGGVGPFAKTAIKDVAVLLSSKRVVERREALRVLRQIGAASVAVLGNEKTGIMACLTDKDAEVRAEAAKVLKRIGPVAERPEVMQALAGLRNDSDERVKRAADAAWAKWKQG